MKISPIIFTLTSSKHFRDEMAEHTCDDYNIQDHVTSKLSKAYIVFIHYFDFPKSELTYIYTSAEQYFPVAQLVLLTFGSVDKTLKCDL